MLWTILSWTCVAFMSLAVNGQTDAVKCPAENNGTEPKVFSGNSNYAVDLFSSLIIFSYAMNQCTAISLVPGNWYKYACVQSTDGSWMVTKTEFVDPSCPDGEGAIVETWYEGNSSYGYPMYFECDGEDYYVKVQIANTENCDGQTVYGGLGGCLMNSPLLTNFYCDATGGVVQFFKDDSLTGDSTTDMPYGYCDSSLLCDTWEFGSSCAYVGEVSSIGISLYGKMEECSSGGSQTTTTDKSAPASFSIITISFALLAPLFWLL